LQPSYGLVQRAGTYEADAQSFEKWEQQKWRQSAIGEVMQMPWTARRRNKNIFARSK